MESNCQNCNTLILNNFCDNCGQKKFKKIDKKYITDELQYTFLHTNKGFLYSVKNLIKNPGKTARAFIDGNRVNHYKPILLVFLLSGISAFISFKVIGLKEIMSAYYSRASLNSQFMNDYLTFTASYNSVIMLLSVPIFAITTKLAFKKWGHNYYEHVVINAYILSFYTLYTIIIVSPIIYIFRDNIDFVTTISSLSMLATPFILVWFFKEFYSDRQLKTIIARVMLTIGILGALFLLLMIIIVVILIIYTFLNGPEALKYMQPQQR